jgi:acyl dehydratase
MLTMMAEPLCTQASGQEFESLRAVRQLRRLQETWHRPVTAGNSIRAASEVELGDALG